MTPGKNASFSRNGGVLNRGPYEMPHIVVGTVRRQVAMGSRFRKTDMGSQRAVFESSRNAVTPPEIMVRLKVGFASFGDKSAWRRIFTVLLRLQILLRRWIFDRAELSFGEMGRC